MRHVLFIVLLLSGCTGVGCWDAEGDVTEGLCACPVGTDVSADAQTAINDARLRAGLAPLVRVSELDDAAQAHADYLRDNPPGLTGASGHAETPRQSRFTGEDHWARAVAAGWSGSRLYENISQAGVPEQAVFGWLRTVYHRVPLLVPEATGMGYGQFCQGEDRYDVVLIDEGQLAVDVPDLAVWPVPRDDFVSGTWSGLERPDPVPDVSDDLGVPISVHFRREAQGRVAIFRLTDPAGQVVRTRLIDEETDPAEALDDEVFIVPLEPLDVGTTYAVHVEGTVSGAPFTRDWQFTTRTAQQTPR